MDYLPAAWIITLGVVVLMLSSIPSSSGEQVQQMSQEGYRLTGSA